MYANVSLSAIIARSNSSSDANPKSELRHASSYLSLYRVRFSPCRGGGPTGPSFDVVTPNGVRQQLTTIALAMERRK